MSRINVWTVAAILSVCFAAGLWGLFQLEGDRIVAVHWNIAGQQDGFAAARVAFLTLPVIGTLLLGLMVTLPTITPRGENLKRSKTAYGVICLVMPCVIGLGQAAIIGSALGYPVNVTGATPALVGCLFVVIGNVLRKLRANYVVGIRTPWTLADERVWDKTHRFGGWVMVTGGLVLLVAGLLPPYGPKVGLVAGVTGTVGSLTVLKSYVVWRDQPRCRPS